MENIFINGQIPLRQV
jgi:hypothetical protein